MTAAERGFLLLASTLGDPAAAPLTTPQLRELSRRAQAVGSRADPLRELNALDLAALGYDAQSADRILRLFDRQAQLDRYLAKAQSMGIHAVVRINPDYPARLSLQLGMDAPPVLFYRGEKALLQSRCISVVGSRRLLPENRRFAETAGRLIAEGGFTLCSGGAQGADAAAQTAAVTRGGSAMLFLPGRLTEQAPRENVICITEDSFDLPFSAQRALHRNRLIHAMGEKTLVAQVRPGVGGTWSGAADNLYHKYSPVFVFDDGSEGAAALMERGAVGLQILDALSRLEDPQTSFF